MGLGSGIASSITLNSALTPEQKAAYQDSEVIRRILNTARRIVIVGLSSEPQKASSYVASYLRYAGDEVIPINPKAQEIQGLTCYPSLARVPAPIDLVDIFRPAAECPGIVEEAIAAGAKAVWMQLRVISPEAAARAVQAGLDCVMDLCVKMEHGRYTGGLHEAGMNTEIVSARRVHKAV
jgi:predicted CoA-binding protein